MTLIEHGAPRTAVPFFPRYCHEKPSLVDCGQNAFNSHFVMNKAELVSKLADKLSMSKKQVEDLVESFTELVTDTLKKGDEVVLAGFGSFSARKRAGRMGVNPQKPTEKIQIPAVTVPKFKAGKALKDALKGK